MHNEQKNILIVSIRRKPAEFLKQSLLDILGDSVSIETYSYTEDSGEMPLKSYHLILASGEHSFRKAQNSFPYQRVMLSRRALSLSLFFEQVFLLPKGSKVLVINETKQGTFETIQSLQQIGIDFLDFQPYWQDSDITIDPDIDIAISPGMFHICPSRIARKIDIGMRQIAITTFIGILNTLNLDISFTENYFSHNKALLVNAYKRLSEQYTIAETFRASLASIVYNINEAIISIENALITECNPAAEKLLSLSKADILGRDISEITGNNWNQYCINTEDAAQNILIYNNKRLFTTYIPFNTAAEKHGIFTFKELHDIEKMEENVRKILYQKNNGHTAKYHFTDIIAESENMKMVIAIASAMAQHDSTILITGESGTGKELLAQSIHNASARRKGPFIAVNFGAIPDNLIESELFGYEEGAFTGAKRSGKKGLFELAHNGTIFLDEIGNSSTWIQSRLLRVLEEKELMRLGDTKVIPVNVRVIVATNKNLHELIKKQLFREDLYYRLNVFPLRIPALRERRGCLLALIKHFTANRAPHKMFSEEALQCIMNYSWPGNIRELKNMTDYISIYKNHAIIQISDLPYDIQPDNRERDLNTDIEIEQIALQLDHQFFHDDIQNVLMILNRNLTAPCKIGRSKMLFELERQGSQITHGQLRTIMGHLEKYELIQKGKTRQATVINNKGKQLLDYFKTFTAT